MLNDYQRHQLEWMIEHGHSLDELMDELTYYQNDLEATRGVNLTVSDVFDAWASDRGFVSLENDGITKDMIRAGIEHGIIRFEANLDPNDPWKTMCCVGEDGGLFYFADTTDIPVADYIRMNRNNLDMVVDDVWEALNGDILRDFADDYERYAAILREPHHGGVSSLTGIPFDIKQTDNVRDWYMHAFPEDALGSRISPELTFNAALEAVPRGSGFYDALGVGDSVVRERVFEELCNRYGYTYDEVYDSWLNEPSLPSTAISRQPEKIAVAAGYRFNLVDAQEASGIDLKVCGTVVTVDGHDYEIMKGATYEDSRKVDDLLDSHGDKPISDYRKRPQGMSLKQAVREAHEASAKLAEKNDGTGDPDRASERGADKDAR